MAPSQSYILPHDQDEWDRLDVQHHRHAKATKGWLYHPSLGDLSSFRAILDCGTGNLVWARAVIENCTEGAQPVRLSKDCTVDACDITDALFHHKPCRGLSDLYVHDVTKAFPPEKLNKYDLINQRMLVLGIPQQQWQAAIYNLYGALCPGGKLNLHELDFGVDSLNEELVPRSIASFPALWASVLEKAGMSASLPHDLPNYMETAGFIDIQVCRFRYPWGRSATENLGLGTWNSSATTNSRKMLERAAARAVDLGTLSREESAKILETAEAAFADMDRFPVARSIVMVVGTKQGSKTAS